MDTNLLIALLTTSIIFGGMYVYIIFLFFGMGGAVLAGFNTSILRAISLKDKKLYKYILRRYALDTLLSFMCLHAGILCILYGYKITGGVLIGIILPINIIAIACIKKNKIIKAAYDKIRHPII